jgi:hypothetical protein
MSTLRIEQYAGQSLDNKSFMQMPELPPTAIAQVLTSSGTSGVSAVLDSKTRCICVMATGTPAVAFRVGDSASGDPVALETDAVVRDGERVWFGIPAGLFGKNTLKVAVIDAP